ncbi:hypothetical protein PVAG01_03597 [Phlyctema vagabunda]|uniref:DNA/RNA-binding protein Alba-like domain-containing protein n=1 Tax=Phlyctema vagabunda TaxID=108571 RepID=A0ABR4PLV7_9HELO
MAKTKGKVQKEPSARRRDAQQQEEAVPTGPKLGKRKRRDVSVSEIISSEDALPIIQAKKSKQAEQPSTLTDSSDIPAKEGSAAAPGLAPEISSDLRISHTVVPSSINSGTQIQKKVKQVLEVLGGGEVEADASIKPSVIMLYAKASAASKMITIAEIAKRELSKDGGHWYQYNSVEALMETGPRQSSETTKDAHPPRTKESQEGEGEENEAPDTTFETMKTPFERAIEGKSKVRAVPLMRIYLSKRRVESLRKSTSEQTNASIAGLK